MTSKDFSRLGSAAQQQVLHKMGNQHPAVKKNKYNAIPTDIIMPDGTRKRFSSKKEANRFRELDLLQRAGKISDLRCQVPFELVPRQIRQDGRKEQPVIYFADFVYNDSAGLQVVEDVKGYADPKSAAYKLYTVKRKLMLQVCGIIIREV